HVHRARQPQPCAGRGAGDAVLSGAGLSNDAPGAEPLREQRLADRVVDLVRTGVRQVLALEPQLRAPGRRQARRERERRGAAHPARELFGELRLKVALMQVLAHTPLEALERGDQRFRNVTAAERAEAAALIRKAAGDQLGEQAGGLRQCGGCTHAGSSDAARAADAKFAISAGLFTPGRSSTPLDTSTPKGCTAAMAAATLPVLRPPASTSCVQRARRRAAFQSLAAPEPLTGPSNRIRSGSVAGPSSAARTTGSRSSPPGSCSRSRSDRSVCNTSGLNAFRISSTVAWAGCRVTATQRTRPRAACASCAARCGVSCREDAANTKPMASTRASTAAVTASGVVMPQILIHISSGLTGRASRRQQRPGERARIVGLHER